MACHCERCIGALLLQSYEDALASAVLRAMCFRDGESVKSGEEEEKKVRFCQSTHTKLVRWKPRIGRADAGRKPIVSDA